MSSKTSTTLPPSQLHSTLVLIIGGTSGVGFSVAQAALAHGAHVTVASSKPAKVSAADSRLQQHLLGSSNVNDQVQGFPCDLSDPLTLKDNLSRLLHSSTANGSQKLDHIVYTAGESTASVTLSDLTVADIQKILVRTLPRRRDARQPRPLLHEPSSSSSITLTGGVMAHRPVKGWAPRAGLVAGTGGVIRGLAVELAPLRVNLVRLGAVKTELFGDIPEHKLEALMESFWKKSLLEKVAAGGR